MSSSSLFLRSLPGLSDLASRAASVLTPSRVPMAEGAAERVPAPSAAAAPGLVDTIRERAERLVARGSLRVAEAIQTRFAPEMAAGKKGGRPGKGAGASKGATGLSHVTFSTNSSDSADPNVALLGVMMKTLIEKIQPGKIMLFSDKGTPNAIYPDQLPKEFSLSKLPTPPAELAASLAADIPNDDVELATAIEMLISEMGYNLAIADPEGRVKLIQFGGLDKGVDPASYFLDLFNVGETGDTEDAPKTRSRSDAIEDTDPMEEDDNVTSHSLQVEKREYSADELLAPFRGIFLNPGIMDSVWQAVSLREFITNKDKNILDMLKDGLMSAIRMKNGAVFNGKEGGTGKTHTMDTIGLTWARCGGYVRIVKLGSAEQPFVGSFRNALAQHFEASIAEARKTGRPALVLIDEASNVATSVQQTSSDSRYYQGALDTIKEYTTKYPELTVIMTTNATNEELDGPLTRSKRLSVITFELPNGETRGKIFAHYLKANGILGELSSAQAGELAAATDGWSGADISLFAEDYYDRIIKREYAERGIANEIDITAFLLAGGEPIARDDVRARVTFASVKEELKEFAKGVRGKKPSRTVVGFRPNR